MKGAFATGNDNEWQDAAAVQDRGLPGRSACAALHHQIRARARIAFLGQHLRPLARLPLVRHPQAHRHSHPGTSLLLSHKELFCLQCLEQFSLARCIDSWLCVPAQLPIYVPRSYAYSAWNIVLWADVLTLDFGCAQLPIYVPSKEEKEDPHLYANNVRKLLMEKGGFGSSEASLVDCRAYIAMLQGAKIPANSRAGQELAKLNGRGDKAVNGVVGDSKKKGL